MAGTVMTTSIVSLSDSCDILAAAKYFVA